MPTVEEEERTGVVFGIQFELKQEQLMSDKTTVELPALEDGRLIKLLCKEGEEIEVGTDIAIFESS